MAISFGNSSVNGWVSNVKNGKGTAVCEKCGEKKQINNYNDLNNLKPHDCQKRK